jgi:Tfp pilus tip-associated adhesin PilY1
MIHTPAHRRTSRALPRIAAAATALLVGAAMAAQTDISNAPLASSTSAQVKPNIMLLMDTSGSMGWGHMPDDLETLTGPLSIGYKSAQCNVLYYNPRVAYALPKQSDGTPFPTPSFTGARYDAYDTASATVVNLSTSFKAYDDITLRTSGSNDLPQAAYYYTHSSGSNLDYKAAPCTDADSGVTKAASTGGTWNRVLVSSTSGVAGSDERTNFAIWYAYYRTRISLIKSAASLAFTPLTDSFRVGFITAQPKASPADTTIQSSRYLAINDFNSTQRTLWFDKLFSQKPGGASPAREGLARVGRHYAGKQDGINGGMSGDPVQYTCQQNFTIMTTDGYWNDQTETAGGGPVDIDGVRFTVNQDAPLTDGVDYSPWPIFEGYPNAVTTSVNKTNAFQYGICAPFFNRSTAQALATTTQTFATTSQTLEVKTQNLQSSTQNLASSTQNLRSSTQTTQSTVQNLASTQQILRSTTQNLRNTTQNVATVTQNIATVQIQRRSTTQNLRSTSQITQSTAQVRQSTLQRNRSTTQNLRTTTQNVQSTTQNRAATSQNLQSTIQWSRSTSQVTASTSQIRVSTTQIRSCDAATELCTPVASCTAGGLITCQVTNTGPTLVASCTPATANAGNSFIATTCATTNTGPTPAGSCSPSGATSGNSFTTTTCNTVTTGPTLVASCTPSSASSGNSWTTTACSSTSTGPTPVQTCTAVAATSGNSFTATTCSTNNTAAAPVQTCTPITATSGNSWTTTTCSTNNASNVPVSSCTPSAATSGNGWTTTTCPAPIVNANVPVATCTASSATSGNSWTTTTCPAPITTGPTPVASCTASGATSGNSFTSTTCNNVTSGPTPVQTCTPVAAGSGNSFTATTCANNNTGPTGVASCTPITATSGNNWTTTSCNTATSGPTPIATCTPAAAGSGNAWTTTTCSTNNTSNVAVASCTASGATSGNAWTATTCSTQVLSTGPVATCTPVAPTAGNGFQQTLCSVSTTTTPVQTCTPVAPTAGNNYATTTCGVNTTTNVPVATCTPTAPTAGNNWTTITCPAPIVTTNVPVASCSAGAAAAGNAWTTTTCPTPIVTTNVPVATCTPAAAAAGNSFVSTTCSTNNTTNVGVQTCTPVAASSGNAWTATTCGTNNTSNVPVASCAPQTAASGNGWTGVTCSTNNNPNVPVATCSPQTAAAGNSWTTITCSTNNTTNVAVGACTPSGPTSGNGFTTTTCPAPVVTSTPSGSCTPVAAAIGNAWTATTCPAPVPATSPSGSCVPSGPTALNNWTTTTCPAPTVNTDVPVASCTPAAASAGNLWTQTACRTATTPITLVTSCTPATPTSFNNFTATICDPVPAQKLQTVTTTVTTITRSYNGKVVPALTTVNTVTDSPVDVTGVCYPNGAPELAFPAIVPVPPLPGGCTAWPCATTVTEAESLNSLADVAQYYYKTDLRPAMEDNVPAAGTNLEDDRAKHQHMTTFVVGLGVSGTLTYRPDYLSSSTTTGDFADIRRGDKKWPLWPDAALDYANNKDNWNNDKSIDDFWHTAVNGRGKYFSAGDPKSVVAGLAGALVGIEARLGSATGAATSSSQPISGDNFAFVPTYVTRDWTGNLDKREINLSTGEVSATPVWEAKTKLDALTKPACDNRKIYVMRPGAGINMVDFAWNTYACDVAGAPTGSPLTTLNAAEQAFFGATNVSLLSQYPDMTDGTLGTADQRAIAPGANLVNFLRGQRGFEGFTANDATKLYRERKAVLGALINGQAVYVRKPFAEYLDAGYEAFKNSNAGRTPMLYVPANDGMLHALYAGTSNGDPDGGKEAWAVIPTSVLPNLYKLADANYKNIHQYSVDGTPTVGDAYDATGAAWKTVLVAGLNAGGKAYYALDVTDPASPRTLWEFKWSNTCYNQAVPATFGADCHLGYTFGKPVISKLADGSWVAFVTSGYNNVNSPAKTGDGLGYLYVLDLFTGQIRHKIATTAGDATTPSGLAQINSWVDDGRIDNKTLRVYGGDVLGNVWRFDVNDTIGTAGREATLVGTATKGGSPQPITTRPELGELNGKPIVMVGTGRLLGATDIVDTTGQSVYGIIDPLTGSTGYADLRGALTPLVMEQQGSLGAGATRTAKCSGTGAACVPTNGWVLDLPDAGERVNVDMQLFQGTLIFASNVPQNSACTTGGYSWLNYVSFATGLSVTTSPGLKVSSFEDNSLITGLNTVVLPPDPNGGCSDCQGPPRVITQRSSGSTGFAPPPVSTPAPVGRRITWREITQ